jgi:nucleoside-diphosphate-sugar epimerase
MSVLVTGSTGFVGCALIPRLLAKGDEVIALVRDTEKAKRLLPQEVKVVEGDILSTDCSIEEKLPQISKVYHLAAIHRLGENQAEEIWETNVNGTVNIVNFCSKHQIPHLLFCSTAYTQGRNPYERSKSICELLVKKSDIPQITIFKPSIIMGTPQHFYPGHVSQFISLLIKVHGRAELVRRKIEGSLKFPVLEPVFRLRANPEGKLNLISIDDVARAIADIGKPGTFWLTHPSPPTIAEICQWVSEMILVKIKIEPIFKPTPIEVMFQKMSKAFEPYLWGDNFSSDLKEIQPITREFIHSTIKMTLLG